MEKTRDQHIIIIITSRARKKLKKVSLWGVFPAWNAWNGKMTLFVFKGLQKSTFSSTFFKRGMENENFSSATRVTEFLVGETPKKQCSNCEHYWLKNGVIFRVKTGLKTINELETRH